MQDYTAFSRFMLRPYYIYLESNGISHVDFQKLPFKDRADLIRCARMELASKNRGKRNGTNA
jgi:capsule polysaccharide modification protein KpsS